MTSPPGQFRTLFFFSPQQCETITTLIESFFWELSPWLLSLLPCTASEFSKCLERNTSQVLGIVFCSFLLIWILASQVSNFCLSFLKRLPKFLLVFLPLNSISVEALCLDPQLLTPHLVQANVPRERVAAEFWLISLWFSHFQDFVPSTPGFLKNSVMPLSRCVCVCVCVCVYVFVLYPAFLVVFSRSISLKH